MLNVVECGPMVRPARSVSPEDLERLADLRKRATTMRAELIGQGPDPGADILGAIAWAWIIGGPDSPELAELCEVAQGDRHRKVWREIAAACGVDQHDRQAVEAFSLARRRRQRR